jgi:hypothetical protein
MKKAIFLFVVICFLSNLFSIINAQIPDIIWAKSIGGNDRGNFHYNQSGVKIDVVTGAEYYAKSITVDASNNIIMAGNYKHTLVFDSIILTNNSQFKDVFLVKYDADGKMLWVKKAIGIDHDHVETVAVDAKENIYIAGSFRSDELIFDSKTITNSKKRGVITNTFLTKYDKNGNVLWSKNINEFSNSAFSHMSVDVFSNVFITGWFSSKTITIGSTTLKNTNHHNAIFLSKYDSDGNVIWVKSVNGNGSDFIESTITDAFGNIYITGYFNSNTITFDSVTLENADFNAENNLAEDIFIAKYDPDGKVLWAKIAGGLGEDLAKSIAADATGNLYITGWFRKGDLRFGSLSLTNMNDEFWDIFLAKYDSDGNIIWVKRAGGIGPDWGNSVSVDNIGNIYLEGNSNSSNLKFGTCDIFNSDKYNSGFLAKYDQDGNALWAKSIFGESGNVISSSLAIDDYGNAYFAGELYSDTISFGSFKMPSVGDPSIFIMKLGNK